MRKNILLSYIGTLLVVILLSACNKNEPYQSLQPSPRDGVYEGKNLIVTINGDEITTVKSVRIFSEAIDYDEDHIIGEDGIIGGNSNNIFSTFVIFNGFPCSKEELRLMTVSTLYCFDGKFNISSTDGNLYYEFTGTFTGNPFSPHSEQGLILEFTSIENPLSAIH